MDLTSLDVVVLVVVGLAALGGLRSGATGTVATLAGAALGFTVGGGVAAWATDEVRLSAVSPWVVGVAAWVLCVALGAALGGRLGALVGRGVSGVGLGWLDRLLGAALRAGIAVVVCWLAAGLAVAVGSAGVDRTVRESAVLGSLERTLPTPDYGFDLRVPAAP